ncbi:MAG: hypothetical protein AAFR93_06215 [Pseudomonadota bacterium]
MTAPTDLEALLSALQDGLTPPQELTRKVQAQNLKRLQAFEALAARQAETLFRAHLEALRAAQSAREVENGLAALTQEMAAMADRTRAELLAQLQHSMDAQDE